MQSKFITFEGIDGTGKTTVLRRVLKVLRSTFGDRLVVSREPGGNPIAEQIRQLLLDPQNKRMDARTEAFLYAAARRQNVIQTILPALRQGKLVLCDRFEDSSVAYQGGGRRLGYQAIVRLNRYATDGLRPDLTIYFRAPAQVGLKRIQRYRKNDIDRLDQERLVFYQRVDRMYQKIHMMDPHRVKAVNANQSISVVTQNVMQILKKNAGIDCG